MDDSRIVLRIREGAEVSAGNDTASLILGERIVPVTDADQRQILRLLRKGPLSASELTERLCRQEERLSREDAALRLAQFILDFGEFLEAEEER